MWTWELNRVPLKGGYGERYGVSIKGFYRDIEGVPQS